MKWMLFVGIAASLLVSGKELLSQELNELAQSNLFKTTEKAAPPLIRPRTPKPPPGFPFSWVPSGRNLFYSHSPCLSQDLATVINPGKFKISTEDKASGAEIFFSRCGSQFTDIDAIPAIARHVFTASEFQKHRDVQAVTITLPDKRTIKGFLGLKPGRRPLVIAACGMFCDADDSLTHKIHFSHLFEESPFHVLSVANITGPESLKENKAFAIGGFDEGVELYHLAQELQTQSSPLFGRITTVHLIGSSLGAHGALYAALYDSLNSSSNDEFVFESVMAMCPVVDLRNAVKQLAARGIYGSLSRFITVRRLKTAFSFVPVLSQVVSHADQINGQHAFELVTDAALRYYLDKTKKEEWPLAPFKGYRIKNYEDLWSANYFANYAHLLEIPTMIVAGKDDPLVRYNDHISPLIQRLQIRNNENIGLVSLERGHHCAFSIAHGWENMSTFYREFILSHDPEFAARQRTFRTPLVDESGNTRLRALTRQLDAFEELVSYEFKAYAKSDVVKLTFVTFDGSADLGDDIGCYHYSAKQAPDACYRHYSLRMSLGELPLGQPPVTPSTSSDAHRLTRFLNTRLQVYDEHHRPVEFSKQVPAYIEFFGLPTEPQ